MFHGSMDDEPRVPQAPAVSNILTREEFVANLNRAAGDARMSFSKAEIAKHDAALREVIRQAVLDVEKLPHAEECSRFNCTCSICGKTVAEHPEFLVMCGDQLVSSGICEGFEWITGPCNCGHAAVIANLKKAGNL